jgi:predicted MFS family arabinose efflux permease
VADTDEGGARLGSVFRVGEFRALWTALVLSIAGDQLARVALSLLVFARTDSPALAALAYALTLLPDLLGGPLLSGLADRHRRREVMVAADVSRAVLVALMAVPGMPLVVVCVLLVVVQLLASPFNAARGAVLPAMLEGDLFVAGNTVFNITYQTGQLAGYVVGGALVAFTGTSTALFIDAATFLVSAVLVRFGLRDRPAAVPDSAVAGSGSTGTLTSLRAGWRLVSRDRMLRALIALACLSGFYVVAEGLAAPYARELGGGPLTVGLLFAAFPAGNVLGMFGLLRLFPPNTRQRVVGVLAVLACAVLVVCAARPGVVGTLIVLAMAGLAASYQTVAAAAFVRGVPDSARGQAIGLANAGLRLSQGLGVVLAGVAAQAVLPSTVVAIFGAIGTALALLVALGYARSARLPAITPVEV